MKTLVCLILCALASTLWANDKLKPLKSEITTVTVYRSGATITREATVSLDEGKYTLVFPDLPVNLDANSIQVSGTGNCTILSVSSQTNYLNTQTLSKEARELTDSLTKYEGLLNTEIALGEVYEAEEKMLLANDKIGGNNGFKAIDLKETADLFRSRLTEIKQKRLLINQRVTKLSEKTEALRNQLDALSAANNKPSNEILVEVSSAIEQKISLVLRYLVTDAGWTPNYDLNVKNIDSPVDLSYKAFVHQSSGEDWKNVKLTISTGNPTESGTKPELTTWYLDYYEPIVANYKRQGKASESYNYVLPAVSADYTGAGEYKTEDEITTTSDYTTVTQGQTTVEFDIKIPYSIASDGKDYTVAMQDYTLPATFEYSTAPKLDRDAFLLAKITGWEDLNLLPGEVNLFFETGYVGKSTIEARNTSDTLDISLGRDKGIAVRRIKLKDFTSTKFLGSNKTETRSWEIEVRNNKKLPVTLIVEDQLPVSTNKDIVVEALETSTGEYNTTTGKVIWRLKLASGESKKLKMGYSVKYPKDKTIIIE
jgi:uncharacterized protein (TIGR02231 family)